MENLNPQIEKLEDRIEHISHFCDGIHVTESVLGIPRIPPLDIAKKIKEKKPQLKVTVSLRTIDKTIEQIHQVLKELIENKIDGVLVLMGDPPANNKPLSPLFPSKVTDELVKNGYKENIEIYLSVPNNPDFKSLEIEPIEDWIREKIGFIIQPSDIGNINRHIENVIASSDRYKIDIQQLKNDCVYNIGTSASIAADRIVELSEKIEKI